VREGSGVAVLELGMKRGGRCSLVVLYVLNSAYYDVVAMLAVEVMCELRV